jgi:hypothetical protein
MGKAAKEHRAKVAKRNNKLAQQKSGMQKAFDKLMEEQIQKLKTNNELNVESSEGSMPFEIFDKDQLDSIVNFKESHPDLIMGNDEDVMNTEEDQK